MQLSFIAGAGTAQNLSLAWEYLGPAGWTPLPADVPAGFGLTSNGTITIGQLPAISRPASRGRRAAGSGCGSPAAATAPRCSGR